MPKSYRNSYLEFFLNHLVFSHITEMIIKIISDMGNMTYKFYMKNPMHMVEVRLKMVIVKNPHLFNALERRVNQPLFRKCSHILFNN